MPERCCLYCRPTDDLETAKIQRAVSQSELIEPLGAATKRPKLEMLTLLRTRQPLILPTEAGTDWMIAADELLKQCSNKPLIFNLLPKSAKSVNAGQVGQDAFLPKYLFTDLLEMPTPKSPLQPTPLD